jgi:hypothetical protein
LDIGTLTFGILEVGNNFFQCQFQDPISFHKFIDIDPLKVYQEWFEKFDQDLMTSPQLERDEL